MSVTTCDGTTPCKHCPWRASNQTPSAVAKSPLDGHGVRWFEKANLLRHWDAAAGVIGVMLPCHMTDAMAPSYGGKATCASETYVCVGLTMLAHREVESFMRSGQNFDRYRAQPGKRFTAQVLAIWAARLFYAGAKLVAEGRPFTLPTIEPGSDHSLVSVPWHDSLNATPPVQVKSKTKLTTKHTAKERRNGASR